MYYKKYINLLVWSLVFLNVTTNTINAQVSISGPSCVVAGTTTTYTIGGNFNTSSKTWTIPSLGYYTGTTTSGSTTFTPGLQISIDWKLSGSGTISVSASTGSANFTVNVVPALNGGAITTNASQTINYYSVPAVINCALATGGSCTPTYSYQWQQSTDNVNWTVISGATTQNLTISQKLIQTTFYQRKVTETNSNTVQYSATATVFVNPPFYVSSATPVSEDIYTGTIPTSMTGAAVPANKCSQAISYQWEKSTDNINWADISGQTSTSISFTGTTGLTQEGICAVLRQTYNIPSQILSRYMFIVY